MLIDSATYHPRHELAVVFLNECQLDMLVGAVGAFRRREFEVPGEET